MSTLVTKYGQTIPTGPLIPSDLNTRMGITTAGANGYLSGIRQSNINTGSEETNSGMGLGDWLGIAGILGGAGSVAGNWISDGYQSKAGTAISNVPIVGGLVGGAVNRLWGSKLNEANIKNVQNKNAELNANARTLSGANTNDAVLNSWGKVDLGFGFGQDYIGKDGVWGHDAQNKFRELQSQHLSGQQAAVHGLSTGVYNADTTQDNNVLFRSAAFGGNLGTNGSDFSTGLVHIDEGGTHFENPNEGVQMGVDNEGIPNLVEENETVYNDYVYSNRIFADGGTLQKFHLPKKAKLTFADISKKLEKEIAERPNDPISKAGFKKQMEMLEQQQERQKQEMEAERAKAAFEALSPEEQTALMQQRAEQEAIVQQAAQQQAMQQPSQEEMLLAQQQQQAMMADGSEAAIGQEPEMNCFGGKINRFDLGGNILKSLGIHTFSDFKKWAKNNKAVSDDFNWDAYPSIDDIPWNLLINHSDFQAALSKDNPALADALKKGYDFGTYIPTGNDKVTIQSINKGNWKTTDGKGWRGSEDLAFKQATEGLSNAEIDALTTEQLADRIRKTAAYQNTNKWLQNSDNALLYLNTLLNDPNTPEVAKKYARKFVKESKWKDGFNYDYATVFGSNGKGVRETNPGTYWHTVLEANRGNQTGNFIINEDGTIEPIIGDVPKDWVSAGNYAWSDKDNDYAYSYYKKPVVTSPSPQPPTKKDSDVAPTHRPEWLRYAGLFGPAAGLGLMAAGVGKPDTAQLDSAIQGAGDVNTADWKPLGNYLTYRPLDIWFEQNNLNAQSRATDRALANNSGGNRGTAMAGLLANGYNSQLASGNLFRQAQEYNDNLRKQVADFNRGTDQFNSEQYGATSRFNADAYNKARQANAQMRLQAAAQKMDADAGWYNDLYGNISGLFRGIGDIGTENFRMNRIAEMAARGDFGTATDETYGFGPYLKKGKKSSEGGKIKRNKRRGLTF